MLALAFIEVTAMALFHLGKSQKTVADNRNTQVRPADLNSSMIQLIKRGKDFGDFKIKNPLDGQISITRVVYLAD